MSSQPEQSDFTSFNFTFLWHNQLQSVAFWEAGLVLLHFTVNNLVCVYRSWGALLLFGKKVILKSLWLQRNLHII